MYRIAFYHRRLKKWDISSNIQPNRYDNLNQAYVDRIIAETKSMGSEATNYIVVEEGTDLKLLPPPPV